MKEKVEKEVEKKGENQKTKNFEKKKYIYKKNLKNNQKKNWKIRKHLESFKKVENPRI